MAETKRDFKIIIVGDSGVGKTHLIEKLQNLDREIQTKETVGMTISKKCLTVNGEIINFQFWDTAGSERYRSVARSYYRKADAVILVYDLTSRQSFDSLSYWLEEIQNGNDDDDVTIILVGNKKDLADKREVKEEDGQAYGDKNGMLFKEVSAMEANYVEELFSDLAKELYDQARSRKISASSRAVVSFKAASRTSTDKNDKPCPC